MTEEPAGPRRGRGALMFDLGREDLDLYSVDELNERIDGLEAEIGRTRAQRDRKHSSRDAANAVFSLG